MQLSLAIVLLLQGAVEDGAVAQRRAPDLVLAGGIVHDGSGGDGRRADVAIRNGRIVAVGRVDDATAKRIDCTGLIVAPGWIDLHNHSDRTITRPRNRDCANYLEQGCTTLVTGNCGSGRLDVAAYLRELEEGIGCNVLHLVPHGSLRREVLGNADRAATEPELERMRKRVEQCMKAGARGMSTGLFYVPGVYAREPEIITLCRVVAKHDGIYATHMRHEDGRILDSVRATIRVAKASGVRAHVAHIKCRGRRAWGKAEAIAELIESARQDGMRVTADQYPYLASSSSLEAYLFPAWAREGGRERLLERLGSPADGPKIRAAIRDRVEVYPKLRIARTKRKEWIGQDLAEIARSEDRDIVDIAIEIQRFGGASVVNFAMHEDDLRMLMRKPWVATASDGYVMRRGPSKPHPRSFGTFPRKIGHFVRSGVVSLAHAVRSASGLPADILGLENRGYVKEGQVADLVVFDATKLRDRATYDKPFESPDGIRHVLLGGEVAVKDGRVRPRRLGRVLR